MQVLSSAGFASFLALLTGTLVATPLPAQKPSALPDAPVTDLDGLRALEAHSIALQARIAPSVCSVRTASGVLVADGIVVTAAHVISRPGRRMPVVLADGRRFVGRSLGVDERSDAGLVQLEVPKGTKLPSVELGNSESLNAGQWVWMFGHPGSRKAHGAPLRFGRLLRRTQDWLVTDCEMSGGDSGGPLFDHEGKLIGIHSRITSRLDVNMHVPIDRFREEWKALLAGERLRKGDPGPAERAAARRRAEEAEKAEKAESAEEQGSEEEPEAPMPSAENPPTSSESRSRRGSWRRIDRRDVLRASTSLTKDLRKSLVEFTVVGRRKAFGTVVAPGGRVVTKASQLTDLTKVRLPDGETVEFEILAVDESEDLALVRVPKELPAVRFEEAAPAPGSFLLTAHARRDRPLAMGVLSVSERQGFGRPWMGIRFANGSGVPIQEVMKDTPAERAGLRKGDRILRFGDRRLEDRMDLLRDLGERQAGDVVPMIVDRGGKETQLQIRLGNHPDRHGPVSRQQRMGLFGSVSEVRRGFSRVLQHDTRLRDSDMGGPVLDLNGRVLGVNIARSGRVESLALPARVVRATVERLEAKAQRREKI